MKTAAGLALAALPAVLGASAPAWPTSYTVDAVFELPYGDITEKISFSYDGSMGSALFADPVQSPSGKTVFETTTIQNLNEAKNYEIVVVGGNQLQCSVVPASGGPALKSFKEEGLHTLTHETLQSVLPDLSDYSYVGEVDCPDNLTEKCDSWRYEDDVLGTVGFYNFYFLAGTSTPYQFNWIGRDYMFGSHSDHYVITYSSYVAGKVDPAVFEPPTSCNSAPQRDQKNALAEKLFTQLLPNKARVAFKKFHAVWGAIEGLAHHFEAKYPKFAKVEHAVENFLAREMHFHRNRHFVNMQNADPKVTHTSAINFLADMSDEERVARKGLKPELRKRRTGPMGVHRVSLNSTVPTTVDWRIQGAVSPVKDQGICGSCWAFSTVGSYESIRFLAEAKANQNGQAPEMQQFSEQSIVDCNWNQTDFASGNQGCNGGEQSIAYEYIIKSQQGKIPYENAYAPYSMVNGFCRQSQSTGGTIIGYKDVEPYSEDALVDAIATQGAIAVSIDASLKSFDFYSSGVYYDPACAGKPDDLDHAVLAAGYGTDNTGGDYFLVKNSWSKYWGDFGYVKMARNKNNNCGIATSPVYPVVSVQDDVQVLKV